MSSDNPFEVSSGSTRDRSGVDRDASFAEVSRRTVEMLQQTAPWVRLIGVLFWICVVLMAIGTIFAVVAGLIGLGDGGLGLVGIGAVYGFVTFVYWLMAKSLTGYAARINDLTTSESVYDLEEAMAAQKVFWKTAGIITVTFIAIYVVLIIFVAAGAVLIPQAFGP